MLLFIVLLVNVAFGAGKAINTLIAFFSVEFSLGAYFTRKTFQSASYKDKTKPYIVHDYRIFGSFR